MKNHSGKNCLAGRTEFAAVSVLLTAVLLMSGCAVPPPKPAPVEDRTEVQAEVREPAQEEGNTGVQVFPLQNPAVKTLLAEAGEAEDQGRYEDAALLLERALRIQPRDPQLLQQMAEIQVQKEDYEQALSFAVRSYDAGPRVGEICARNWRTIGLARERLGDSDGSMEARERVADCVSAKPRSY